jgi:tyrosinase
LGGLSLTGGSTLSRPLRVSGGFYRLFGISEFVSPIGTASLQHPAVVVRQRRSITELSVEQLSTLRHAFAAVEALSDDRGFQYHAGIHGLPLPKYCKIAHGQPLFLPWHRAYLYNFEMALRDQVPDATLAWWDWRVVRQVPPAFAEKVAAGSPNPLYSVHINDLALRQGLRDQDPNARILARYPDTARQPGLQDAPPLPTKEDIDGLMGLGQFLDFQEQLEGFHNDVHVWVGGHMSDIPFAAYDPIFWAHHTMIDRVWRLWQLRHPHATPPRQLLRSSLPPFRLTVSQTLDVTSLGYDYAITTTHDPGRP